MHEEGRKDNERHQRKLKYKCSVPSNASGTKEKYITHLRALLTLPGASAPGKGGRMTKEKLLELLKIADGINASYTIKPDSLKDVITALETERKKGKWFTDPGFVGYWICSECRKPYPNDTPLCPWCGAEME